MSGPPDLESLYALLTGDPFRLSFEQIGRLTDRQIYDVLLYPREEDGSLKVKPERVPDSFPELEPTPENQRLVLFSLGQAAGIPAEELERIYREKYGGADG